MSPIMVGSVEIGPRHKGFCVRRSILEKLKLEISILTCAQKSKNTINISKRSYRLSTILQAQLPNHPGLKHTCMHISNRF
jgi:hypothetical protein